MTPHLRDIPSRQPDVVELVFRICLSLIFLVAGANHLIAAEQVTARLAATGAGDQLGDLVPLVLLVIATGVVLLFGGLMLLTEFKTRWAALVLMATLIPITVAVQLEPGQSGPLFKNIAIFGGLLHFYAEPARTWGLDWRASRATAPTPVSGSTLNA